MVHFTEEAAEEIIIPIEEKNHNNDDDDDEFEDNNNVMSSSSKQVSFGIIDETYNGPPSFPLNNRRSSLSRTKTAAKSFREERSLRYSALNKATNNAFVADAWVGKHRRTRTKYIMEATGTFILNMVIGTYYEGLAAEFQPLVVVAAIILVVTIGAPISGAHYNPALTIGFWIGGDRVAPSAWLYVVVICISAFLAHLLIYGLHLPVDESVTERRGYLGGLPTYPSVGEWCQALVGEFLGTYFAIFIVLYTAMLASPPLGTFGPVMVGLGFYASIMTFRSVSGSVLNPGLAFGLWLPAVMFNPSSMEQNGVVQYWNILLYVAVEMLGGVLAGYTARAWIVRENRRTFTWAWNWILEKEE